MSMYKYVHEITVALGDFVACCWLLTLRWLLFNLAFLITVKNENVKILLIVDVTLEQRLRLNLWCISLPDLQIMLLIFWSTHLCSFISFGLLLGNNEGQLLSPMFLCFYICRMDVWSVVAKQGNNIEFDFSIF